MLIRPFPLVVTLLVNVFLLGCVTPKMEECRNERAVIVIPAFGKVEFSDLVAHDELFVLLHDKYPVSPGHTLIVARRPVARFQQLTMQERTRLLYWIDWAQTHLSESLTPKPDAFNLGLNDGPAAGQTKQQFHFHIIPRYLGDVTDPRGGVRFVIPSKARYWDAQNSKGP